ncbi:MAG: hypothetical protein ABR503_13150, partial [Chitinophagaceae bacterium]
MKTKYFPLICCVAMLVFSTSANAQVLKDVTDKIKLKTNKKNTKEQTNPNADTTRRPESPNTNADGNDKSKSSTSMTFNSKYDFVPGEKVMGFEDFSKAEIGDFPTRWNTNATAEVVTLNNKEGKWLKIAKEGVFHPEFITNLPDNFTLEFDLAVNPDWRGTHIAINVAKLDKPQDFTDYYHYVNWRGNHAVHMQLKP